MIFVAVITIWILGIFAIGVGYKCGIENWLVNHEWDFLAHILPVMAVLWPTLLVIIPVMFVSSWICLGWDVATSFVAKCVCPNQRNNK